MMKIPFKLKNREECSIAMKFLDDLMDKDNLKDKELDAIDYLVGIIIKYEKENTPKENLAILFPNG